MVKHYPIQINLINKLEVKMINVKVIRLYDPKCVMYYITTIFIMQSVFSNKLQFVSNFPSTVYIILFLTELHFVRHKNIRQRLCLYY